MVSTSYLVHDWLLFLQKGDLLDQSFVAKQLFFERRCNVRKCFEHFEFALGLTFVIDIVVFLGEKAWDTAQFVDGKKLDGIDHSATLKLTHFVLASPSKKPRKVE